MIGGTLFRYFFRRYMVITLQFFAGVLVISYLADFTEFSRRASTLPASAVSAQASATTSRGCRPSSRR